MADLETLLEPISEDDPCGPDLAYDQDRQTLEQAFDSSVSMDVTGEEATASDTDWRKIIKQTEDQLKRTKDVWLPVYLCRAGAKGGDLETVELGAKVLAGLFERYWDELHPKLDEYGMQGRKSPCDSLTRNGEFLFPLQRMPLLQHARLGTYSGQDFERFQKGGDTEDGYGMFRGTLQDTPEENLVEIADRLDRIEQAIRAADAIFTEKAAGEDSTHFLATYQALSTMKAAVLSFTSAPAPEATAEASDDGGGYEEDAGGGPRISGSVNSREDVIRALDAICDYYRRREPASPVPLALQRARDWVNKDNLAILRDIAPGGVDEAKRVLTITPSENDE